METLLVAVGLFCLCGISMSHDLCRKALLRDVDFPGSDIKCVTSPDAEHCQLLCTQHPACRFFTFLRADWTRDRRQFYCYLKSTPSGQPRVQITLHGLTSGFSLKPCNPDPKPCLPSLYHHVDFPGADFRSLFTADYEECQRECTHDPACQFFTFVKENFRNKRIRYKCHLKFSWTVPRTPSVRAKAGLVSGFSHRLPITGGHHTTTCQGKLFPNIDVPGQDVKVLPAASPEHCQILCSAYHRCTFFAYVSHHFKCYLKNNPNTMNPRHARGITSGLPTRFCQLDTNWLKRKYVGVDFPRNDIRHFVVGHLGGCQRACTEDPNCQFYSYITHRHLCYLKRVIILPAPPKVTKLPNLVSGFSLKNCHYKL